MDQIPLKAEDRKILGRKVKSLRNEGKIPAHVFGHKVKTIHISVEEHEFITANHKAGETGIVGLKIGGESKPVLIRGVQKHPVTGKPLHIDFYQVNLKEKVTVAVPIEIVGESPAVEKSEGLLLTPVSEIEVEALPTDLPESIKVDVSKLEHLNDAILVKDLKVPQSVKLLLDSEETIAKIGELVTREMEEVEAEIEAERTETAEVEAETEAAKGEAVAEEQDKTEEKKEETEPEEKAGSDE